MANNTKQLLLLAGPSGTGKSTLIKAIKQKKLSLHISQKLNIKDLPALPAFQDFEFEQLISQKQVESTIVHYDLYNNYLYENCHNNILKIIEPFDEVIVVTLYVPTEILMRRIKLRIIKAFVKQCLKPSNPKITPTMKRQWRKYQGYQKTDVASKIYREWLEFTQAEWVSSHWLLDSSQKNLKIQAVQDQK